MDCVKRVAEVALEYGINTLVDLDLTDLFFSLYKEKDYFDVENYNPDKFKLRMTSKYGEINIDLGERIFDRNYSSPVYGFTKSSGKKL